jgi:hypothetical protein
MIDLMTREQINRERLAESRLELLEDIDRRERELENDHEAVMSQTVKRQAPPEVIYKRRDNSRLNRDADAGALGDDAGMCRRPTRHCSAASVTHSVEPRLTSSISSTRRSHPCANASACSRQGSTP